MESGLTYNSVSPDTKKSSHAISSALNIPNTHHPIFHPAQCPPSILLRLVHRPPPITIYPALPNHLNYLAQDLASFILIDSITIRPISRVASFHAATLTDHVAFRSRSPSSPIACHRPIPNPPQHRPFWRHAPRPDPARTHLHAKQPKAATTNLLFSQ